jgi:hypothetical protein
VAIHVTVHDAGRHVFALRTSNLSTANTIQAVDVRRGHPASLVWNAHVEDGNTPWVAVVVADGRMETRQELAGVAPRQQ